MIGRIRGRLLQLTPPAALVELASGLGYELELPMSSVYNLPAVGQEVILLTHSVYREDAQLLYGFLTDAEREAFRSLIRISGVGPKLALSVLSGLSVDELAQAIQAQDPVRLVKIPGIGKKTAERLLLELRDKLSTPSGSLAALPGAAASTAGSRVAAEVLGGLVALGYSEREASAAVKALPEGVDATEGIRLCLKALFRA